MSEKLMTFEEFRTRNQDLLGRQRDHLRDDAVADGLLRDGIVWHGWDPWSNAEDVT